MGRVVPTFDGFGGGPWVRLEREDDENDKRMGEKAKANDVRG